MVRTLKKLIGRILTTRWTRWTMKGKIHLPMVLFLPGKRVHSQQLMLWMSQECHRLFKKFHSHRSRLRRFTKTNKTIISLKTSLKIWIHSEMVFVLEDQCKTNLDKWRILQVSRFFQKQPLVKDSDKIHNHFHKFRYPMVFLVLTEVSTNNKLQLGTVSQ